MTTRARPHHIPGNTLWLIGVGLAALPFLMPFLWMAATAFKTQGQIYSASPSLLPDPPTLKNFAQAWTLMDFPLHLRNSMIVATLTTAGSLTTSSLVGYAFAHLPARGQRFLWIGMLSTAILPPTLLVIPQFLLISRLGWMNTYLPLIIVPMFGNVIYVFLFRQYFRAIPLEIIESAILDGSNPFSTYLHIAIPLARPVLILVGVFTFIASWNDFLNPLIYLNSQDTFTLSLALSLFQTTRQNQLHLFMPMSFMALLPIIALFLYAQRFLDKGLLGDVEF